MNEIRCFRVTKEFITLTVRPTPNANDYDYALIDSNGETVGWLKRFPGEFLTDMYRPIMIDTNIEGVPPTFHLESYQK